MKKYPRNVCQFGRDIAVLEVESRQVSVGYYGWVDRILLAGTAWQALKRVYAASGICQVYDNLGGLAAVAISVTTKIACVHVVGY